MKIILTFMLFQTVWLPLFCGIQMCCVQKTGVRNSLKYFKIFRICLYCFSFSFYRLLKWFYTKGDFQEYVLQKNTISVFLSKMFMFNTLLLVISWLAISELKQKTLKPTPFFSNVGCISVYLNTSFYLPRKI